MLELKILDLDSSKVSHDIYWTFYETRFWPWDYIRNQWRSLGKTVVPRSQTLIKSEWLIHDVCIEKLMFILALMIFARTRTLLFKIWDAINLTVVVKKLVLLSSTKMFLKKLKRVRRTAHGNNILNKRDIRSLRCMNVICGSCTGHKKLFSQFFASSSQRKKISVLFKGSSCFVYVQCDIALAEEPCESFAFYPPMFRNDIFGRFHIGQLAKTLRNKDF